MVTADLALQNWRARNFMVLNQLEADLYPHYGLLTPGTSYDCGQLGTDLTTALHLVAPSYRPLAKHWESALDAVRGQLRKCTSTPGTNESFAADAGLLDDVLFEIQDS